MPKNPFMPCSLPITSATLTTESTVVMSEKLSLFSERSFPHPAHLKTNPGIRNHVRINHVHKYLRVIEVR